MDDCDLSGGSFDCAGLLADRRCGQQDILADGRDFSGGFPGDKGS